MRIGSNVHTSKHTHMFDMLHIILYIFICTKWNEMKKGDRSRSFIKYWWIGGKCLYIFHHHCQEVGNSLFLALRSTVFQQPTRNYYCVFFCLFICFSSCCSLSGYVISSSLSRTSRGTGKQNNAILNSMKDGGRCSDSFNCVGYSATFLIWFESNLGVDWLIFANFYSRPWQWPKILIL